MIQTVFSLIILNAVINDIESVVEQFMNCIELMQLAAAEHLLMVNCLSISTRSFANTHKELITLLSINWPASYSQTDVFEHLSGIS